MLIALLAGCIAVPLLTPPARVSFVGGPAIPTEPVHLQPGVIGVPLEGELRATVQPLGMFEELEDRPLDINAGFVGHFGGYDEDRFGATLEGSVYPWHESWSPQSRARFRVYGAMDAMAPTLRSPRWDPGIRGGVGIDWGGFLRGQPGFSLGPDASWVGVSYGEWAIGAILEGGYQRLETADLVRVGLGLEVQMPATAGFLLLPWRGR